MTNPRTHVSMLVLLTSILASFALTEAASAQDVRHHRETFAEYLPARYGGSASLESFTRVQMMQPHFSQRIVNYDGTPRLSNGIGAVLAPNEIGHRVEGGRSTVIVDGINLATGAWVGQLPGIDLPATVPWTIGVAYNSVGETYTGIASAAGYHGPGWTQISQPEIFFYSQFDDPEFTGSPDAAEDVVYVVFGTGRYAAYKRLDATSDYFVGVNGVGGLVEYIPAAGSDPEFYVLVDQLGQKFQFFGFVSGATKRYEGQLWKKTGTNGEFSYVGHPTDTALAETNGFDSVGRITDAYDSEGRHFEYTYGVGPAGDTVLTSVTATESGGSSPVATVTYSYYDDSIHLAATGDGVHPDGYLRSVTRTTPTTTSGNDINRSEYIRYDNVDTSSLPTSGPMVSLVLSSQGVADANPSPPSSGSAMNLNALDSQSTDSLKVHSDIGLTHDHVKGSGRVTEYFNNGNCGCSGSASDETTQVEYTDPPIDLQDYVPFGNSGVDLLRDDEFRDRFILDPTGMPTSIESEELPGDEAGDPETEECESKCIVTFRRDRDGNIIGVRVTHVDCDDLDGNGVDDAVDLAGLPTYTHCTTFCDGSFTFNRFEVNGTSIRAYAWMTLLRYDWDCDEMKFVLAKPGVRQGATAPEIEDVIVYRDINPVGGSSPNCPEAAGNPLTDGNTYTGDHDCAQGPSNNWNFYVAQNESEIDTDLYTFPGTPSLQVPTQVCLCDPPFDMLADDTMENCTTCDSPSEVSTGLPIGYIERHLFGETVQFYYTWTWDYTDCNGVLHTLDGKELVAYVTLGPGFRPGGCETCEDPWIDASAIGVGEVAEEPLPLPDLPPSGDQVEFLPVDGSYNLYDYRERDELGVPHVNPFYDDLDGLSQTTGDNLSRDVLGSSSSYSGNTTSFSRTWHSGAAAMRPKAVTATPEVSGTTRNGSGAATPSTTVFRDDGTLAFQVHADGQIDYTVYDDNQQLIEAVSDVTTAEVSQGDNLLLSGVATLPSTGAGLTTAYEHDAQGRITQITSATGRISKTYYTVLDNGYSVQVYCPHVIGAEHHGPASVSVTDLRGRTVQSGTIAFSGGYTNSVMSSWISTAQADLASAVSVGTLASLAEMEYDGISDRVTKSRVFYDIDGSSGNQFDETIYGYDDRNRPVKTVDPTGTIDRVIYDNRNRVISVWTGTTDGGVAWDDINGGGGNMVKGAETEYDGGNPNGPGLTTKRTLYPDGLTDPRVTEYLYDSRRRLKVIKNPMAPHTVIDYDAADRPIYQALYSGDGSDLTLAVSAAQPLNLPEARRISLQGTFYDERDRVFRTVVYGIDRSNGQLNGDEFVSEQWYDESGRLAKTTGSSVTKMVYDSAGRLSQRFLLAKDADAGSYTKAVAGATSTDIVISQSRNEYDGDGRAIMTIAFDRLHDQDYSVLGPIDDLDTDFTDDSIGRVSVSAVWYDGQDRVTHSALYGTVASMPSYAAASPPTVSTSGVLVSKVVYDAEGRASETIDPSGRKTVMEYDDLGRTEWVVESYVDGTPGPGTDVDRKTSYDYDDGLQVSMTAHQVDPLLGDQTTYYDYTLPKGTGTGESAIASNRMLHTAQYPDSSGGTDVTTAAYNAIGELVQSIDQAGNVLETEYDLLGRPLHLMVDTAASLFSSDVKRITTTYNDLGQVTSIAQWDDADPDEILAAVLDELTYAYDDWGQLTALNQDFNSAVATSGGDHYSVNYNYNVVDDSSASDAWQGITRTQRLLKGTAGATVQRVDYGVGAAGTIDEMLQRTATIGRSTGPSTPPTIASYEYLGAGRVVGTEFPVTGGMVSHLLYDPATTTPYDYLDQFGRVTRDRWTHERTVSVGVYDIIDRAIQHDELGNIMSVDHGVWGQDRAFTLDGLDRLTGDDRGVLSAGTIASPSFTSDWSYDALGNQLTTNLDFDNDGGTPELSSGDRTRVSTFDPVNALLTFDNDGAGAHAASANHDFVGNLIEDDTYEYEYDVFGRLVATYAVDGDSTRYNSAKVTAYRYNGAGHRIAWISDNESTPSGTVDANDTWTFGVYDERWRLIAEVGAPAGLSPSSPNATPQKTWVHHHAGLSCRGGSSYIDALVLVDTDAASDGTFEKTRRYLQNWRYDVIAMLNDAGVPDSLQVQDYTAYGEPMKVYRADRDYDGDVDLGDFGQIGAAFNSSVGDANYNALVDYDYDGDVDLGDYGVFGAEFNGTPESSELVAEAAGRGYAGYVADEVLVGVYHVRNRAYLSGQGQWSRRDPIGYLGGASLYGYVSGLPMARNDPMGLGPQLPFDPFAGEGGGMTPFELYHFNLKQEREAKKRRAYCEAEKRKLEKTIERERKKIVEAIIATDPQIRNLQNHISQLEESIDKLNDNSYLKGLIRALAEQGVMRVNERVLAAGLVANGVLVDVVAQAALYNRVPTVAQSVNDTLDVLAGLDDAGRAARFGALVRKLGLPLEIGGALIEAFMQPTFEEKVYNLGSSATAGFLAFGWAGVATGIGAPVVVAAAVGFLVGYGVKSLLDNAPLNPLRGPLKKRFRDQIRRIEDAIQDRREEIDRGVYWDSKNGGRYVNAVLCSCGTK